MARYPVAYIRRSSADADNPGDISREAQEAAVRELAHRDGHNGDLRILDDWNRSADAAKEAKRQAFTTLLTDIEAGRVSAVYAYALDRLYRSMRTFVRLTDAAKAHDVRIVTLREGVLGGDGSPMAQAFAQITAVFSELELNTAKARAHSALAARRRRGDRLGQAPYGYALSQVDGRMEWVRDEAIDLDAVRRAYLEAGSVLGACGKLEEWGIAAPRGGTRWSTSMVSRTVEREWPELLAPKTPLGRRRSKASAILTQLLRCPFCGRMLTPNTARGQYYCANGPRQRANHPRYTTREADVLPFLMEEADRLEIPAEAVQLEGIESRQEEVEAKWRRARAIYVDAGDEGAFEAARARYKADMAALEGQASTAMVAPFVDWDNPPEVINGNLRSMWRGVNLGPDLLPVSVEWINDGWRRP